MKRVILTTILTIASIATLFSQNKGTIKGTVTNEINENLAGININLIGTKYGAATNEYGEFNIKNIPEGTYTIAVSAVNYEDKTKKVRINSNDTTVIVNFSLEEST